MLTTHVGFHSGASLNSGFNGLLSRMDSGVAIFFVISGFLLFRPHAVAWLVGVTRPRASVYARHRGLRILPALWIAVVGAALLLPHDADVSVANYAYHATLTQIYVSGHETSGLTQMWSLATEAAFYAALPVLGWPSSGAAARPAQRRCQAHRARGAACDRCSLDGAGGRHRSPQWGVWLPGYVGWFGLGMALALWQAARSVGVLPHLARRPCASPRDGVGPRRRPLPRHHLAAGRALRPVAAHTGAGCHEERRVRGVRPPGGAARGRCPARGGRAGIRAALGGRLGGFFGDISYGIFCYHLIVLGLVEQALGYQIFTGGFLRLWAPTLAITIAVATLSFYAVERPIMRRGRRAERPTPSPATPETAAASASSAAS